MLEGAPRKIVYQSEAAIPEGLKKGQWIVKLHSSDRNDSPQDIVQDPVESKLPFGLRRLFGHASEIKPKNENFRGVVLYNKRGTSFAFNDGLNQEVATNRMTTSDQEI